MRDDRAVSEILGYALVFSLVLVTVAIVSVSGLSGFQNAESFQRQQNAQTAFDVLHGNLEDIYYQDVPRRATEIALGETQLSYGDPVTLNVTVDGESFVVESQPLVQRFGEGDKLVYEAGAVFYTTKSGGGVVLQEPPMLFQQEMANVMLANVSPGSSGGVGGGTILVRARSTGRELHYPNATQDLEGNLTINITSPRADLWHEYLTSQSGFSDCLVSSGDNRVKCNATFNQIYVIEPHLQLSFTR